MGASPETLASVAQQLNDDEFFISHVQDFQDEQLDKDLVTRFSKLSEARKDGFAEKYAMARGKFQAAMGHIELGEVNLHDLRCLIEDDVSRADHEVGSIDVLGSVERRGATIRALSLIAIMFGIFFIGYYYLGPEGRQKFAALEYLAYETESLAKQSKPMNLSSENLEELRDYVTKYPNLGFKPLPFYALRSENWSIEGASVIDYEFIKIPVVAYSSFTDRNDKLFLFQYPGKLKDLPKSSLGEYKTLQYQTYSNSQWNIVAWQAHEDIVAMMIGTSGAQELAKLSWSALHRPKESGQQGAESK